MSFRTLPAHALAQAGDVRRVVAACQAYKASCSFRDITPSSGCRNLRSNASSGSPPLKRSIAVNRFQKASDSSVRQSAPPAVRPNEPRDRTDRGLVFRQGELESHICVQMAVRKMMDYLANRPAAGPVRRVQLLVRQASTAALSPAGADSICLMKPARTSALKDMGGTNLPTG